MDDEGFGFGQGELVFELVWREGGVGCAFEIFMACWVWGESASGRLTLVWLLTCGLPCDSASILSDVSTIAVETYHMAIG